MSAKRYTDEFKVEAVRQVIDRGFKVAEVAERPGVTTHSLYAWLRKFGKPGVVQRAELDQSVEVRRLKAELRRVTEERDILKKPPRTLPRVEGKVRSCLPIAGSSGCARCAPCCASTGLAMTPGDARPTVSAPSKTSACWD